VALPVLASAADDSGGAGTADTLRTRRTDLLRRASATVDVAATSETPVVGGTRRWTPGDTLPPRIEPMPTLPGFDPAVDALNADATLEVGPSTDFGDFYLVDVPCVVPTLSSETQAVIRRELASLHMLDLPVVQ
jgi:hypothetical protein